MCTVTLFILRASVSLSEFTKFRRIKRVVSAPVFNRMVVVARLVIMGWVQLGALLPLKIDKHEMPDSDISAINVVSSDWRLKQRSIFWDGALRIHHIRSGQTRSPWWLMKVGNQNIIFGRAVDFLDVVFQLIEDETVAEKWREKTFWCAALRQALVQCV